MIRRWCLILLVLGCSASTVSAVVIEFTPDAGVVTDEGGTKVVTVAPNTPITFDVAVTSAAESLSAYELNFLQSDTGAGQLVLSTWANNDLDWSSLPGDLSPPGDTSVAGFTLGTVAVPTTLGSFQAIAPTTPSDYLITVDSQIGGFGDTVFTGASVLTITDYGDTVVRVVPEPASAGLAIVAGVGLAFMGLARKRRLPRR